MSGAGRLPAGQGRLRLGAQVGVRPEVKLNPFREQLQARVVENTLYVVHANAPANDDLSGSHGRSRVIAADRNIVQEPSMFGEEVVTPDLANGIRPGSRLHSTVDR